MLAIANPLTIGTRNTYNKAFIYMVKSLHISSYYSMWDIILIIIIDILPQVVCNRT